LEEFEQVKAPTREEIETWWNQMPRALPEYSAVVSALKPILFNMASKIVAIDGPNGAGKTTLGRYLSYVFNSSLIETDLFSIRPGFEYDLEQIRKLIVRRKKGNHTVFVEGVTILQIFDSITIKPDFHIYWENAHQSDRIVDRADRLGVALRRYCRKYNPRESANLVIAASIDRSAVLSCLRDEPVA
jgi:ABC-type glutathione transport system ATPase component